MDISTEETESRLSDCLGLLEWAGGEKDGDG